MFGNLLRECGVLGTLSDTAQNTLSNLITLLLGIAISFSMRADAFVGLGYDSYYVYPALWPCV